MDNRKKSTGIVDGTENRVLFYRDGDEFTFFPAQKIEPKQDGTFCLPVQNGFVNATGHHGERFAIHFSSQEQSIVLLDVTRYQPQLYYELPICYSNNNISSFRELCFVGGDLNSLVNNSLFSRFDKENSFKVTHNRFEKEYSFSTPGFNCTVRVWTMSSGEFGFHNSSINNKVCLKLIFDKDQDLASIHMHYCLVNTLISIMSNRRNNYYEEVYVRPNDILDVVLNKITVHLAENSFEKTEKSFFECISFDQMDACISNIFTLFYSRKDTKPSYSLGFIPRSDAELYVVNDDLIRSVYSGLECELSFMHIKSTLNPELISLINSVKDLIKEHRETHKNHPVIPDKTYNMIFGSIANWGFAASDRIKALYTMFGTEMYLLHGGRLTDDEIDEFVKYRNNITHGKYQEITPSISKTTNYMKSLVICSFLSRMGMTKDTLLSICRNKQI